MTYNPMATLIVRNFGLGPAILSKPILLRLDRRTFELDDNNELRTALADLFRDKWAQARPLFSFRGEYAIPKDGELRLIQVEVDRSLAGSYLDTLRKRVSVEVPYRSAYKEAFTCRGVSPAAIGPSFAGPT